MVYFFKVVKKVARSGYQPYLAQFLDVLDVNDYYSKKLLQIAAWIYVYMDTAEFFEPLKQCWLFWHNILCCAGSKLISKLTNPYFSHISSMFFA